MDPGDALGTKDDQAGVDSGDAGPLGQRCDDGADPYALDAFTGAAPDARPAYKLRDRRRPLALTLPPELIG